ncbi:MAG: DinB family protein [Acidobacteria bacterium]|nr:DinB family protein [Acidobacteriota bacterium]
MDRETSLRQMLRQAWRTNNRVTTFLVEHLPPELWPLTVPSNPRRTVRGILSHIHNDRCMWIRMIGRRNGIKAPGNVDRHRVTPKELTRALERSSAGILRIFDRGLDNGGFLPRVAWGCFPPEVLHFFAILVAHEAHHRGQIVMLARQSGHRLPATVTVGLWQWTKRCKEIQRARDDAERENAPEAVRPRQARRRGPRR